MARYRYLALDGNGRKRRGKVTAVDEWDAEERLTRIGLAPIRISEVRRKAFLPLGGSHVSRFELANFYERLAESVEVGLPLPIVLEENARHTRNASLREAILEIRLAVEEGNTLSQAMEKHRDLFDRLQTGILRMGEAAGTLPQATQQLAHFLTWEAEQRAQIRRALIYPAFILVTVCAVGGVWIGYVLPQVSGFLRGMDIPLPAVTRFILAFSEYIKKGWIPFTTISMLFAAVVGFWARSSRGRYVLARLGLKIPLLGPIFLNLSLCRLCLNFAMMLDAGITIGTIFDILSSGSLGNRYMERDITRVHQDVIEGKSLHEAFAAGNDYPDIFLSGVRTGELTGNLAETFRRLGRYYDREASRSMKTLTTAFEPASLLLLGSVFGAVILAILLPLYDVFSRIRSF